MVTLFELRKELEENKLDRNEENLVKLHDRFMMEYGWIPLKEFKELPIPTLLNLLDCIKDRCEKEKQEYDKMKVKTSRRK